MDHDQAPKRTQTNTNTGGDPAAHELTRSRWTPKPEQILILESIFNSGMVNPPKEETVRIRKLLERFGAVRDANVFYWFQNRRSRSRRRARQLQASLAVQDSGNSLVTRQTTGGECSAGVYSHHEPASCSPSGSSPNGSYCHGGGFIPCSSLTSSFSSFLTDDTGDDLLAISRQMGFTESNGQAARLCSTANATQLNYQPGSITVYINGIASEIPRGPIDLRATFGQDVVLVHSSGEVLPVNEYGTITQNLQMGECYFLVCRFKLNNTRFRGRLRLGALFDNVGNLLFLWMTDKHFYLPICPRDKFC